MQLPAFWVPYLMALCSAQVVLVPMWHLLHPGVLYLCGLVFLAVGLKK
jgi:hypothetical protein